MLYLFCNSLWPRLSISLKNRIVSSSNATVSTAEEMSKNIFNLCPSFQLVQVRQWLTHLWQNSMIAAASCWESRDRDCWCHKAIELCHKCVGHCLVLISSGVWAAGSASSLKRRWQIFCSVDTIRWSMETCSTYWLVRLLDQKYRNFRCSMVLGYIDWPWQISLMVYSMMK